MNREELIAAMQATAANPPRLVKVPGWGEIYIRDVTVAELDEQSDDTADPKNKRRVARGAARVICDAEGKHLFDPDNEADVALLAKQPWKLLRIALADPDDKATPSGN